MKYFLFPLEERYQIERDDIDQGDVKRILVGTKEIQSFRIFRKKFDGKVDYAAEWEIDSATVSVYTPEDTETPIALDGAHTVTITETPGGYAFSFLLDTTEENLEAGASYVYTINLEIGTERIIVPYYVDIITMAFPYQA